ncbi:MAG: hypothetical protein RMM53_01220 [Bacteroidia bacterium]|nr:hypothetical protein [Bacteroidia bacterium]MDW8332814.1 hypothetical protein [Bacteroidia bacterium]
MIKSVFSSFARALAQAVSGNFFDWGESPREYVEQGGAMRPFSLKINDFVQPSSPAAVYWRFGAISRAKIAQEACSTARYSASFVIGFFFERDVCDDANARWYPVFGEFSRRRVEQPFLAGPAVFDVRTVSFDKHANLAREFGDAFVPVETEFVLIEGVAEWTVLEHCAPNPCRLEKS